MLGVPLYYLSESAYIKTLLYDVQSNTRARARTHTNMCVCVCVCVYIYIYIYIYIYKTYSSILKHLNVVLLHQSTVNSNMLQ